MIAEIVGQEVIEEITKLLKDYLDNTPDDPKWICCVDNNLEISDAMMTEKYYAIPISRPNGILRAVVPIDRSNKRILQLDRNGNNIAQKIWERLPNNLGDEGFCIISGFENSSFKTFRFSNQSILEGCLVQTKKGVFISDGSDWYNFIGVVLGKHNRENIL